MTNRSTAVRVTPSIQREFIIAVIQRIPDLTDEQMRRLLRNEQALSRQLREALISDDTPTGEFLITCEGKSKTSELLARGKYDGANKTITDERFSLRKHAPVQKTIVLVVFEYEPTTEDVLAEFTRLGLERPDCEDALYFGIQHPEEQRRHSIVFLREPGRGGIVLMGDTDWRIIDLCGRWVRGKWDKKYVFAAIRPAHKP